MSDKKPPYRKHSQGCPHPQGGACTCGAFPTAAVVAQPQGGAVAIRADKREIAMTRQATEAMTEIQSAIMVALQFPRDEKRATDRLLEACKRVTFAEDVEYEFPRGKKKTEREDPDSGAIITEWVPNIINGPSVYLAREAGRLWGNLRSGVVVVAEDIERRTIEAFAWDMETNRRESAQDVFEKKVQRKIDGVTQWVTPDERDLRELQNRRAAILERNCLLQIIPSDVIARAIAEARETMRLHYMAQKDAATKKLVEKFASVSVTPDMICEFLGIDSLTKVTPEHLVKLRPIYTSIAEGNSRWSEYVAKETAANEKNGVGKPSAPERATTTVDDVLGTMKAGAGEDNRGHGADNLQQMTRGTNGKQTEPAGTGSGNAQRPMSVATTEDVTKDAVAPENASQTTSGNGDADLPPMPADCLILQGRVVRAKGDLASAEAWLARASKLLLPNVNKNDPRTSRTFRSLTALEARTITAAIEDNDIRL